jgi:Spy/CpxP family protein refolding chaperone
MTRFRYLTAGVLVAGLLAGGAALAQGPRGGGAGRGAAMGRGMVGGLSLEALNLTQAQQDLIRDIRERHRNDARQAEAKLRELQDAQRQAIQAIPLDEPLIRSTTLALAEAQVDFAVQQARVQNEIFAALTPAQQDQLTKARAEQAQRRQQRQAQMQERARARRQNQQ